MPRNGFIPSPNYSGGHGLRKYIVLHTAEGARNAKSLGYYFQGNVGASSHDGVDGSECIGYVNYDDTAWTVLNANSISVNLEICGFSRWTRAQWLSTDTIDGVVNPRNMIRNAARWVKEMSVLTGIPIIKRSPSDIDTGKSGLIYHNDWSVSQIGQGDHSDPGPNFPLDVLLADIGGTGDDELSWTEDLFGYETGPDGKLISTSQTYKNHADRWLVSAAYDAGFAKDAAIAANKKVDVLATKLDALIAKVDGIAAATGADPVALAAAIKAALDTDGDGKLSLG